MTYYSLHDFALVTEFEERLYNLSLLAEPESWDYRYSYSSRPFPVLRSYIYYTFMRLEEEGKIIIDGDRAAFNTGLVTENQEEIFAVFWPNRDYDPPWFLKGFFKESDRELSSFSPLPPLANYFDDPSELLYDSRLELRIDVDHVINENKSRFPEPFASMKNNHQLRILLDGAIKHVIRRVQRNYKTAIPQYYFGSGSRGKLQLLLPLCLTSMVEADLALAVYKQYDIYKAATCLTLDMAYNNARLIARPDSDWLHP